MRQVAVSVHLLDLTLFSVGKWVYEVLISSQGLMQIGWCTINCRFNQEVHMREGALPKGGLLLQTSSAGTAPEPLGSLPDLGHPLRIGHTTPHSGSFAKMS